MNFIIFVLGVAALVAGIAFWLIREETKFTKMLPLMLVGVLLIILSSSFTIIPTGYTGVRTTFGQIDEITMQNGFNWKVPFVQSIKLVNNKQQDDVYYEKDKLWSETSTRTAVYYKSITVTYQINNEKSAWIYANISDYKNNLVSNALVSSSVKSASKTLSDTDATNRGKIEPLATEYLQNNVNQKYGENVVIINKISISSADFEEDYNKAISNKQKAQLDSETQAIENQKAIDKAKADKEVKITNAEAEAQKTMISAEATAKANEKISSSITKDLIDYKLAEARMKNGWITVNGAATVIKEEK